VEQPTQRVHGRAGHKWTDAARSGQGLWVEIEVASP
jgi:hypothetical protein